MVPCGTECGIGDILIFSYTLTFMLGTTLSRHILMLWDCNLTELGPGTNRWCPTVQTGDFPQYKRWCSTIQTGDVPQYKQVMFHSTKRWCSTVQKRWCSTVQTGDAAQYKQVMLHSANRWCSIVQRDDVPHDDILIFPCGVLQVPGGTECVIDDILIFPYTLTFILGRTLSSHILMLWDCNLTELGPGTNRWCPTV